MLWTRALIRECGGVSQLRVVEVVDHARPGDVVRWRDVKPRGRLGDDVAVDGLGRTHHQHVPIGQRQASRHPGGEPNVRVRVDRPERVDVDKDLPVLGTARDDARNIRARGRMDVWWHLSVAEIGPREIERERIVALSLEGGFPSPTRDKGRNKDSVTRFP